MRRRSQSVPPLVFDPEIERTCRGRRRQRREEMENEGVHAIEDAPARTLRDYATPNIHNYGSSILAPAIQANNFELKPGLLQMLANNAFEGDIEREDPHAHLASFLEICGTIKMNGVTEDALRLRLFPFSLTKRAKEWLKNQPSNKFTSWSEVSTAFLSKYFPPAKTAQLRNAITGFMQSEGESLYQAWERYKELLRKCPHHGIPSWMQVQTFYNGLLHNIRMTIDAAAGGSFMAKNPEEALALMDDMASNNYQWSSDGRRRVAGVHNIDEVSMLRAKVDSLTKSLEAMKCNVSAISQPMEQCDVCGEPHSLTVCPIMEQANYLSNSSRPQGNPYSHTCNPGWRNHPNFSWSGQGNQGGQTGVPRQPFPPGFQNQQGAPFLPAKEPQHPMEERVSALATQVGTMGESIKNLERTVTQLVSALASREKGTLPSQPEPNPRGQCHAIILRSGKEVEERDSKPLLEKQKSVEPHVPIEEKIEEKAPPKPYVKPYVPPIPFPQRLKQRKLDAQYDKFFKIFRQLHINIPLSDALSHMPKFVKFFKELLSNRKKLEDAETVPLNEECSAIIQKSVPPKLKDPGSFSLPCTISKMNFNKALCDLGASVSLMPYSIYRKLGLGELKRTKISLQLADRSVKYPMGIVEDVLVKVDRFFIPCDFVVLEMDEDSNVPIILGRPFLATAGTNIDVRAGKLTLNVGEETAEFELNKVMKFPPFEEKCCSVDLIERIDKAEENFHECPTNGYKEHTEGRREKILEAEVHSASLDKAEGVHDLKETIDASWRKLIHPKEVMRGHRSYKDKLKSWSGRYIQQKEVKVGQEVFLSQSRFQRLPKKVRYQSSGPFHVVQVYPNGAVEIEREGSGKVKVNGSMLKSFVGDGWTQRETNPLHDPPP